MRFDYHLHTEFSWDSFLKADELVQKAIALGYMEIAITEHIDLLPQELSEYGLPSILKYKRFVDDLATKYPGLSILCGLEIGDYHRVKSFAEGLIEGFDFFPILGSVHFLSDGTNVAIPLAQPLSPEQIRDYYIENLRLVSSCNIDVLAHLGVYKRYYPSPPNEDHVLPIIKEILDIIIQRNIALEINLSGFRKPLQMCVPNPDIINIYKEMGGDRICFGSDSHAISHFALPIYDTILIDFPEKRLSKM